MKVLLIIYLASIAYYFLGLILVVATIRSSIRKMNVKLQKYSFAEFMLGLARTIVLSLIPIINILFGSIYLFSDRVKEETMRKALERKI